MPDEIDEIFDNWCETVDNKLTSKQTSSNSSNVTIVDKLKRKLNRKLRKKHSEDDDDNEEEEEEEDLNLSIGCSVKRKHQDRRNRNRQVLNPELFFANVLDLVESKYCQNSTNDNNNSDLATISLSDLQTYDDPDDFWLKGKPIKFGDSIDYHLEHTLKKSLVNRPEDSSEQLQGEQLFLEDSNLPLNEQDLGSNEPQTIMVNSNNFMTNNEVVVTDYFEDQQQIEQFAQIRTREIGTFPMAKSSGLDSASASSGPNLLQNNSRALHLIQNYINCTNLVDIEFQVNCLRSLWSQLTESRDIPNQQLIQQLRHLAMKALGSQFLPPPQKCHPILIFDSQQNVSFKFYLGSRQLFTAPELINNVDNFISFCSRNIYEIISIFE